MTDKKFVRDLNRLIKTPKKKTLGDPAVRESILGTTLIAEPVTGDPTGGGGGGIASPLTESTRTNYPAQSIISSDGFFTMQWYPVQSIDFTDADSNPVTINYSSP